MSKNITLVVAAVIINEERRVLVTQRLPDRKFANQWEFPGGKLNWGEFPEDGLKREIAEELNFEIKIDKPLHIIHYTINNSEAFVVMFYLCSINSGELQLRGCQDAKWISIDDFSGINFLDMNLPVVKVLKKYIQLSIL